MLYYETLYIVHPALEAGRLKDLIVLVEKNITQMGGKTHTIDVWGKKKLAYPINKEKYGISAREKALETNKKISDIYN